MYWSSKLDEYILEDIFEIAACSKSYSAIFVAD